MHAVLKCIAIKMTASVVKWRAIMCCLLENTLRRIDEEK